MQSNLSKKICAEYISHNVSWGPVFCIIWLFGFMLLLNAFFLYCSVTDALYCIFLDCYCDIIFISGVAMILAALAIEAGLPDGVLNIVHGTHVSIFSLNLF